MSELIKGLAVGSFFLQYVPDSNHEMADIISVVLERIEQGEDVIVNCFGITVKRWGKDQKYHTLSSSQNIKMTPISHADAAAYIQRHGLEKHYLDTVAATKKSYETASNQAELFGQYFMGIDQGIIEGETVG